MMANKPILSDGQLMERLLSAEERRFAEKYLALEKAQYHKVLLDRLAEMRADDTITQVEAAVPDEVRFVFCKVTRHIGPVEIGG